MRSAPHLFSTLQMPLRDALRGVSSLADATEETIEPAVALLPEPIRDGFRAGLRAVHSVGRRLKAAPIDPGAVRAAADTLADRAAAPETLATVVVYAWEHLPGGRHGDFMSETLLAGRLSTRPLTGRAPAERAARLIADIRTSAIIARRPGLADADRGVEQARIDQALIAIALWLLAARAPGMAEEETILGLSSALVAATRDGVPDRMEDAAGLARYLQALADHL